MKSKLGLLSDPNALWHTVGITLNAFYPIFLIIFITRFNGIDQSGLFSFTFYFAAVLSTISMYGGRIFHVSEIDSTFSDSHFITLRYAASLVMFAVAAIVCWLSGYDAIKIGLLAVQLVFRTIESISDSYYGIMQNNNNLSSIGKSFAMKSILSFSLFIGLDLLTHNILIAGASFIIANYSVLILYDRKKVHLVTEGIRKFDRVLLRLFRICFPIFLFSFLQLLLMNATRYVVDVTLSDATVGYFGIMLAPASIVTLFAQFVMQPYLRGISELHHNSDYKAFKRSVNKILVYLSGLGIIAVIATYALGATVLSFVYGIDLMPYRIELTLVVLGGIFSGGAFVLSNILTVLRSFKGQFYIYGISLLFAFALSFILINRYELRGALLAFFGTMILQWSMFWITYTIKLSQLKHDSESIGESH